MRWQNIKASLYFWRVVETPLEEKKIKADLDRSRRILKRGTIFTGIVLVAFLAALLFSTKSATVSSYNNLSRMEKLQKETSAIIFFEAENFEEAEKLQKSAKEIQVFASNKVKSLEADIGIKIYLMYQRFYLVVLLALIVGGIVCVKFKARVDQLQEALENIESDVVSPADNLEDDQSGDVNNDSNNTV